MYVIAIEADGRAAGYGPPSEGQLCVDGTVLLGYDDRQFSLSQFQLRGNLAMLPMPH